MKKYQSLYLRIKRDIESGILKAGERLPSVREEATTSSVSINTVLSAYGLLTDENLIRARQRGGYYVCAGALEMTQKGIGQPATPSEWYDAAAREAGDRLDRLYEQMLLLDPSFATAAPGRDLLPVSALSHGASRISAGAFCYGNPQGDIILRRRIAAAREDIDGRSSPENILITNGATEAMAIVMHTLLHPGDTVVVESPTYLNFFRQLAPLKTRILEIPVGPDGMDLDILEQALSGQKIRMIITQPNVQNPTGITMGDKAKRRLARLAETYHTWLVQDDVYGDISFGSVRPRNLTALSDYGKIVLVSSFSKTVTPGLRIGWLNCPGYIGRFLDEKLRLSMDTCRTAQAIMASFIGTTAHRRHLADIRKGLESRIHDHIRCLAEVLPRGSAVRRPSGGCLLWISFTGHIHANEIFERCAGQGLIIAPGALFSASCFFDNYIRLNAGERLTAERSRALGILGESVRQA